MVTEEELSNMSPEQIAELQKQNCIFCHIIAGKAPSKKIYEDDVCIAVMDINPANLGHMLLMPKKHAMIMPQLSEEEIAHLGIISKKLSHACLKAIKAHGTNIFIANGAIAGQKAPHFMIHIIPRKEGDGVSGMMIPAKKASENDLQQMYDVIKKKVNSVFGIKEDVKESEKEKQEPKKEKQESEKEKQRADEKYPEEQKQSEIESKAVDKNTKKPDKKLLEKEEDIRTKEIKKEFEEEEKKQEKASSKSKIDLDKIASMFLK